jgi:hypothetical protein
VSAKEYGKSTVQNLVKQIMELPVEFSNGQYTASLYRILKGNFFNSNFTVVTRVSLGTVHIKQNNNIH